MIKPFFSIIIPCYNSKKTIGRLLQSIVDQNMLKYDIQVILADDCSTEKYDQEIKPFLNKLYIKQVSTDYNCCPGNTRQKGVQSATGQWITFSDHDDYFEPNTFSLIKKALKEHEKENISIIYTLFKHVLSEQYYDVFNSANYGWTHGKFFNLQNFWKKYNIHFIKDLRSHEDVSIATQIQCITIEHPQIVNLTMDLITYNWLAIGQSLSNKKYQQGNEDFKRPFLDVFYCDHLDSTIGILIQKYKQYNYRNSDYYKETISSTILLDYFYMQFNFFQTETPLKRNFEKIREYLLETFQLFDFTLNSFYQYCTKEKYESFKTTMRDSFIATDYIPYKQTFSQWLEMIYCKKYLYYYKD